MSLSVSKRMAAVRPSPTGAVLALAMELRAAGRDIVSLGAGEPDFDTPQHIKDAAIAAIKEGKTKYTPIDGTAELKAVIQRKFARDNELDYKPEEIIVTSGAKQALFNLCIGLLGPADEAIIPAPYWVSYPDMVKLADGEPVFIKAGLEQTFKITPEQLDAAITPRTRLFVINSPSNPTGVTYSREQLKGLADVLLSHPHVLIATDDMYEHIIWGKEPFANIVNVCEELFPRTIVLNGVSKAYAMTGWRIGYAGGPRTLIQAMKKVQSQSTSNPAAVSQAAAQQALNGDQSCIQPMLTAFKERHDYVVQALNRMPGVRCTESDGTFYSFPDFSEAIAGLEGVNDDVELAEFFLQKAGVALVPGSAFGAPGYLRLSFATSMEVLETALGHLKRALSS